MEFIKLICPECKKDNLYEITKNGNYVCDYCKKEFTGPKSLDHISIINTDREMSMTMVKSPTVSTITYELDVGKAEDHRKLKRLRPNPKDRIWHNFTLAERVSIFPENYKGWSFGLATIYESYLVAVQDAIKDLVPNIMVHEILGTPPEIESYRRNILIREDYVPAEGIMTGTFILSDLVVGKKITLTIPLYYNIHNNNKIDWQEHIYEYTSNGKTYDGNELATYLMTEFPEILLGAITRPAKVNKVLAFFNGMFTFIMFFALGSFATSYLGHEFNDMCERGGREHKGRTESMHKFLDDKLKDRNQ